MPNTAQCSDGNACTDKDSCKAGVCSAGASVDCDDGNAAINPAQTELPVQQGEVRVFPNPAKDILHVQLPDGASVANIVITDLPGRTLLRAEISSLNSSVSVAGIPAGVYILSVKAAGQTTRTKFLISE